MNINVTFTIHLKFTIILENLKVLCTGLNSWMNVTKFSNSPPPTIQDFIYFFFAQSFRFLSHLLYSGEGTENHILVKTFYRERKKNFKCKKNTRNFSTCPVFILSNEFNIHLNLISVFLYLFGLLSSYF